ncbi:MAG: hypothetical protein ACK4WJ_06550, partial [Endomicrobiia bacterium]
EEEKELYKRLVEFERIFKDLKIEKEEKEREFKKIENEMIGLYNEEKEIAIKLEKEKLKVKSEIKKKEELLTQLKLLNNELENKKIKEKEIFDLEALENPYLDTRIYHIAEDKEIKKPVAYKSRKFFVLLIILGLATALFNFFVYSIFKNNEPNVLRSILFVQVTLSGLLIFYSIRTNFFFLKSKTLP